MAAWYKNQGKTLVDALNAVYEEYGYYLDALDSFVLKGKDGAEKIGALMQTFRAGGDQMFAGVERVQDFAKGIGDLPKENVLKFLFTDGSCWRFAPPARSRRSRCTTPLWIRIKQPHTAAWPPCRHRSKR